MHYYRVLDGTVEREAVVMPRESSRRIFWLELWQFIIIVAMAGWTVRPSSVPFTAFCLHKFHIPHSTTHPDPDPDPVSCLAAFSLRFVCA